MVKTRRASSAGRRKNEPPAPPRQGGARKVKVPVPARKKIRKKSGGKFPPRSSQRGVDRPRVRIHPGVGRNPEGGLAWLLAQKGSRLRLFVYGECVGRELEICSAVVIADRVCLEARLVW